MSRRWRLWTFRDGSERFLTMKTKLNEEFVYQAILTGDLEIMPDGTIWRLRKRVWDRWQKKAVSRPCKRVRAENDCGEYLQVRIMLGGVRVCALAHRLVFRHFKGPIPDGLTINHKDGKKKRNHPDNLEPATYSEQVVHALQTLKVGRIDQNGPKNAMAKLTPEQVATIRERRKAGEKLQAIADDFGIKMQAVSKIARRERWDAFPG